MIRNALSKVAWVGRTASMVFGLSLVMALVLGATSVALAGNLDPLKIGSLKNVATKTTALVGKVASGSAFAVKNPSGGSALGLQVNAGQAPLTVNADAGKATNLDADKVDGKSSEDLAQLDPATAQNGSLHVDGLVRSGSETGTSQPPTVGIGSEYDGVMTRRVVSTDRTAGSVIARTDQIRLQRDGTNGGLQIAWDGNTQNTNTVICTTVEAGYGAGSRYLPAPNAYPIGGAHAGTFQLITDGDSVPMMHCMFGDPVRSGHTTEVSMHRKEGDSTWVGTVTSTVNQ